MRARVVGWKGFLVVPIDRSIAFPFGQRFLAKGGAASPIVALSPRSHPDLLLQTRFTFIQRNTRFLLSRGPSIEKLCSKNMMRFFSDFGRRRLKIDSPCRNAVLGDLGRSPGESSRNRRSSALEEVDRAGRKKKVNWVGSWRWRAEVLESGSEALMDYKRPVVFRGEKKENESKPPFYPLSSSPPRPTLVNQLVLASSREPHPPAPPAPRAR